MYMYTFKDVCIQAESYCWNSICTQTTQACSLQNKIYFMRETILPHGNDYTSCSTGKRSLTVNLVPSAHKKRSIGVQFIAESFIYEQTKHVLGPQDAIASKCVQKEIKCNI